MRQRTMNESIFKDTLLVRSMLFAYKCFLKPSSKDTDRAHKELIVNIIFVGSIFFLSCLYLIILYKMSIVDDPQKDILLTPLLIAPVLVILLHCISRRGKTHIASYGLVMMYVLGTGYGACRFGIGLPTCVLVYAFIIVTSSILIGTGFALTTTIGIVISFFCLHFINGRNIVPIDISWVHGSITTLDILTYTSFLFTIQTVSWFSNREIKRFKKAHKEKVAQLYRFAEFGRLSSGIFHDLMNPLTAIVSNIHLLKDNPSSNYSGTKEHIHRAVQASKRMENFITLTKKQMSTETLSSTFIVNNEIEEVLSILHYKALKEKISVEFHAMEEIRTHANPMKLNQIMTNLICNAIDSYDNHVTRDNPRSIIITLSRKNSLATISVKDYGCGIPSELISKIFDPFFTTKSINRGMGLGLSTTQEIVKKDFNGTLTVQSIPNQGSLFTFIFPLTMYR